MSQNELLESFREQLQDKEAALEIGRVLAKQTCDADAEEMGEVPDEFDSYWRHLVSSLTESNLNYVFDHSESPIETLFLNALVIGFTLSDSAGLVTQQVPDDAEANIKEFHEVFPLFQSYLKQCEERGMDMKDMLDDLESENNAGNMVDGEFAFMRRMVQRYVPAPFSDAFHMTLQPRFPNVKVDGKSVRPDILFWIPTRPDIKIIVECDGFDYHSDKRKFASDRKRDRQLQQRGYQVHRFSGTEIYNDPVGSALDLAKLLWELRGDT
jgi:REase_MTES_1575